MLVRSYYFSDLIDSGINVYNDKAKKEDYHCKDQVMVSLINIKGEYFYSWCDYKYRSNFKSDIELESYLTKSGREYIQNRNK